MKGLRVIARRRSLRRLPLSLSPTIQKTLETVDRRWKRVLLAFTLLLSVIVVLYLKPHALRDLIDSITNNSTTAPVDNSIEILNDQRKSRESEDFSIKSIVISSTGGMKIRLDTAADLEDLRVSAKTSPELTVFPRRSNVVQSGSWTRPEGDSDTCVALQDCILSFAVLRPAFYIPFVDVTLTVQYRAHDVQKNWTGNHVAAADTLFASRWEP